ncbi:MAG: ABC transporter permease [Frankia sp.]|nr:ABC transporter permease [Frankia sp.]
MNRAGLRAQPAGQRSSAPGGPGQAARRRGRGRRPGLGQPVVLAYLAALLLFGAVSAYSPGFAEPGHIRTLLVVAAFTGLAALGQTMVIIGGGIDLSVPWTLNCAAMLVTALCSSRDLPLLWAMPVILLGGALVGLVNGLGVTRLLVPPIVMTLAMNVVLQGVLLITTEGFPAPPAPRALSYLASGRLGPVPVLLLIWAALAALVVCVERLTVFGRELYATGSSRTVALLAGVPVNRTIVITYVLSGMGAALAGMLLAGYSEQAFLGMGDPYLFTSIAAVAIGGASILGGSGSYLGTIAGALVLTVLTGLLPVFRLDIGALQIIYGGVILATVALGSPRLGAWLNRARGPAAVPEPDADAIANP